MNDTQTPRLKPLKKQINDIITTQMEMDRKNVRFYRFLDDTLIAMVVKNVNSGNIDVAFSFCHPNDDIDYLVGERQALYNYLAGKFSYVFEGCCSNTFIGSIYYALEAFQRIRDKVPSCYKDCKLTCRIDYPIDDDNYVPVF